MVEISRDPSIKYYLRMGNWHSPVESANKINRIAVGFKRPRAGAWEGWEMSFRRFRQSVSAGRTRRNSAFRYARLGDDAAAPFPSRAEPTSHLRPHRPTPS